MFCFFRENKLSLNVLILKEERFWLLLLDLLRRVDGILCKAVFVQEDVMLSCDISPEFLQLSDWVILIIQTLMNKRRIEEVSINFFLLFHAP